MKTLNQKGVWLSVLIMMGLGFVWYAPFMFGPAWARGLGKDINNLQPKAAPLLVMAAAAVVFFYTLAWLIRLAKANSYRQGWGLGGLVWGAFVFPWLATMYLFMEVPLANLMIDGGYVLVGAHLGGALIAGWPQAAKPSKGGQGAKPPKGGQAAKAASPAKKGPPPGAKKSQAKR